MFQGISKVRPWSNFVHNIANIQNPTSYQRFLFLRSSLCGNTAPCNLMKCSVHFSRGPLAGLKPGRASQESRNDKVWIRPPDDVPLYPGDGQEGDRRNVLRFSLCWVMDGYCYLDLCCSTINHRKMCSLFDQKSDNLQYNTLVSWANGTNDSSTKRLTFQVFLFHNFL